MHPPVSNDTFKAASEEAARIVAQLNLLEQPCDTCLDPMPECHTLPAFLQCSNHLVNLTTRPGRKRCGASRRA